jgi:hypothetical protein
VPVADGFSGSLNRSVVSIVDRRTYPKNAGSSVLHLTLDRSNHFSPVDYDAKFPTLSRKLCFRRFDLSTGQPDAVNRWCVACRYSIEGTKLLLAMVPISGSRRSQIVKASEISNPAASSY